MDLIHRFASRVVDEAGLAYAACVYGEQPAHVWQGWIVFFPVDGGRPLATDRETSQPNRGALEYWASGLQSTYLDGALQRAMARQPAHALARLVERMETDAELARGEAAAFERAAEQARQRAEEAERVRRAAEQQLHKLRAD
jgi:hypothetical protein